MLCVRCSHQLPPRADRCVRCFALNPPQAVPPPRATDVRSDPPQARGGFSIDSQPPAARAGLSIDSKPPAAPQHRDRFSIDSAPAQAGSFRLPRSEPAPFVARMPSEPAPSVARISSEPPAVARAEAPLAKPMNLELPFGRHGSKATAEAFTSLLAKPFDDAPPPIANDAPVPRDVERAAARDAAEARPISVPIAPAIVSTPGILRASGASRLAAWSIDSALLFLLACSQILLTATFTRHDFLDLALSQPLLPFWLVLTACDALACSWLFAAMGRTPGMAALGQHLRTLDGGLPTPGEALQRALLALLSAAPALFGFSFALFDPRGQTLHDKLCGCIVTVD